jgi:hypothetical protein
VSLSDWHKIGWLTTHRPTRDEVRGLVTVADRDLRDSDVPGLSADTQLGLACNAALQAATAALAASGYRAPRESKHLRTIETLAFTIQLDPKEVRRFDAFRKKRNVSDYERAGATSDREAAEMKDFARDLLARVAQWLALNHRDLL